MPAYITLLKLIQFTLPDTILSRLSKPRYALRRDHFQTLPKLVPTGVSGMQYIKSNNIGENRASVTSGGIVESVMRAVKKK